MPGRVTAVTRLEYDGLGLLSRITENGVVCRLVRDRVDALARPLVEIDANSNVVRRFVWSNDCLLAQIESNGVIRIAHFDELGRLLAFTDNNGALTDEFAYHPNGRLIAHSGTTETPFTWLDAYGVWDAEHGLYLTRHRAYDANLMRFLQTDPLGLEGGLNLYVYCANNPINFIDPLGLCEESNDPLITLPDGRQIPYPPGVDIGKNIKDAKSHYDPRWFYNQVKNKGPWDYKRRGSQYQDFGNFNYGATGKAFGYSENTLLREAGRAQQAGGTSRPEWGDPGWRINPFGCSGSYGDDPADASLINQGFQYYDQQQKR